ncbi:MAG TPA: hypothetical protein VK796_00200 [Cytophaga sp.]|jgi:hypothetical protein|nr:hypothetical protein [Cytophaga sp.]
MTKVFALLSIAAMFAFASCADKKVEEAAAVDTAVVVPVEAAPVTTDSLAKDSVAPVEAAPAEAPKH